MHTSEPITDLEDYTPDPSGEYDYYSDEINASMKTLNRWKKQADKIVDRYLGGAGKGTAATNARDTVNGGYRLNMFHSNVQTMASMLYGNLPKIDVSRRYADSSDDVGRVAAETLERLLNLDVERDGQALDSVLRSALFDRLVSGLGCGRVRYDVEVEEVPLDGVLNPDGTPATEERILSESAPVDYYFWGDVLWSWARNFSEVRWVAFRNYMTKEEVLARFGEEAADDLQYKQQQIEATDDSRNDPDMDSAWMKAEVWEIWDKAEQKVVWISLGYDKSLESTPDPLQLSGFFPIPPFLMANPTTSLYAPTPDYNLAQDLYLQIDVLQERIVIITDAVRVVGVYDSGADGIERMFNEGVENTLIPISNWALFAEKGGLRSSIEWMPLSDIVNALDKLRELRDETIGLLQQITGMSDIMRGDLGNQYEGVGQSAMKAKFGSVRVQALQDQFAQFASGLMQLKAEVIAKHFSAETIVKESNMQFSPDRELLSAAVELIKNPEEARLRVSIRPESVAMVDYALMKEERTGYLNALSTFMQSAGPLMEADPNAKPFLLQMLQWGLAGFKGSSEIEGVMDRAIEESQKEAQQGSEKPDPEQMKLQMAMQLEQAKIQGEMQKIAAKTQADMQVREQDKQADIETAIADHQAKMAEITAGLEAKLAEIKAKTEADMLMEQVQTQANVAQIGAQAETEVQKDVANQQLEVEKAVMQTELKLNEIAAASAAKIAEARVKKPSETSNSE